MLGKVVSGGVIGPLSALAGGAGGGYYAANAGRVTDTVDGLAIGTVTAAAGNTLAAVALVGLGVVGVVVGVGGMPGNGAALVAGLGIVQVLLQGIVGIVTGAVVAAIGGAIGGFVAAR